MIGIVLVTHSAIGIELLNAVNGIVGPQDLTQVLSLWGFTTPGGYGDLNGDGIVGPQDLTIILSHWGASPYGSGGGGDGDGHDH